MKKLQLKGLALLPAAAVLMALMPVNATAQKKPAAIQKNSGPAKPGNISKPSSQGRQAAPARPDNVGKSSGLADRNNVSNSGNKNINAGNKTNVGNKVDIDNSRKNVNVNIDNSKDIRVNNSRNTSVRRMNNYRPYPRPPYRYGGFRFYAYHPYYYHPYRPFVWGPVWHPWGFFVATLATTAIIISIVDNDIPPPPDASGILAMGNGFMMAEMSPAPSGPSMWQIPEAAAAPAFNQLAQDYYYDQGVFYIKMEGGYTVVAAPVGANIKTLPSGYETVKLDDGSVNYYYGGAFYEKSSNGYVVVPPTAGAVVEHLSDGGEEVKLGDVTYVKLGDTYYQPIQLDGKSVYEVASVEEDK